MLFGFLLTLYTLNCILLILIILIQQGKGGLGIGALGNSQMIFGGSGGQDLFQKMSWTLGGIYIFGSLGLSLLRAHQFRTSTYMKTPQYTQESRPIKATEPINADTTN